MITIEEQDLYKRLRNEWLDSLTANEYDSLSRSRALDSLSLFCAKHEVNAVRFTKERTQLLYLKDSVNAIFDSLNKKPNKLNQKIMKEIKNRISKKTAKKIFSWIDAKMEEAKNEQVCFDEYFSEDLPKGCESDYDIYKKHFFNKKKEEK